MLGLAVLAGSEEPPAIANATLTSGVVPNGWEVWVVKAGGLCPEVSPPIVAAQIEAESGWNAQAVSPAGAQGLSQFMPGTWPTWAQDDDGNGQVSPFDPADAIMAQGRYDCALYASMAVARQSNQVSGDLTDLMLAAYNAGSGAVLEARGIPQNVETPAYVSRVRSLLPKYSSISSTGPFATNLIAAASKWMGTPYVWGGGDPSGPTGGLVNTGQLGFDCSGLTLHAVYVASNGAIGLPHSSGQQSQMGQPVPLDQLAPGDLVFFQKFGEVLPGHVGIYLGNRQMVSAPHTGDVVKVSNIDTWGGTVSARRFG